MTLLPDPNCHSFEQLDAKYNKNVAESLENEKTL